jgi:hypothetical protein
VAGGGAEVNHGVRIRRIVAGFDAGAYRRETLQAIAALAAETQAELLGLFIEDTDLLQLARLPFAAEVGYPSAARRNLDFASLEQALRARAEALHAALSAALQPTQVSWSFRVAREAPSQALAAALAEGHAPALLIPPRGKPNAERRVIRQSELTEALLRELIAAARPVLVLPEGQV